MRKTRKGYTLLELVLVGAIGLVLLAISYPAMSGLAGNGGMTGKRGQVTALDQVKSKLAEARSHAMEEGRAYRFAVVSGKGNYRLAPDTEDFWGQGASTSSASQGEKQFLVAGALPQGTCFCNAESGGTSAHESDAPTFDAPDKVATGSYQAVATFLPDGTVRDDGKIGVKTVGAKVVIVMLQSLTSVITTQEE